MTFGLSLSADDRNKAATLFGSAPDPSLVSIEQDSNDKSIIHLVYPSEFLRKVETGFEITPTVNLRHPTSHTDFGDFSPVRIICNSPPPKVYGAAVYKDSATPPKYVVRFNMPESNIMKATHFDIKTLTINGEETSVTVKPDGTFTFSNPKFSAGTPSITLTPCSVIFHAHGQESYFLTDDIDLGKYKSYTIKLKDEKALSSSVFISVNTKQLEPVVITEKKDALQTPLSSVLRKIAQDDGNENAVIVITPAAKDSENKDTSDSIVAYELYDSSNTLLRNGRNNGGKFELELPDGNYLLKAYSQKEDYADSELVVARFDVIRTNLFVSSSGNDLNPGSKTAPLKTLNKAFDKCGSDGFLMNVTLLSDITYSSLTSCSGSDKIIVDGKNHYSESPVTFNAGTDITLKDVEIRGGITANGKLTLSGSTCVKTLDGSSLGKINFALPNLFVNVEPDLNQSQVAELSWNAGLAFNYIKGTKVLASSPGNLTQDLCDKFISANFVIVKDGDEGKLDASGGNINVNVGDGIKLSIKSNESDGKYKKGKKATLSASKGTETLSVSRWDVKVFSGGGFEISDKFSVTSDGVITIPADIPSGSKLNIVAVASYESFSYSATFAVTVE